MLIYIWENWLVIQVILIKVLLLASMLDNLCFQMFYGSGEVRYGLEGVDLSEFMSITKVVPRVRERTWGVNMQLVI